MGFIVGRKQNRKQFVTILIDLVGKVSYKINISHSSVSHFFASPFPYKGERCFLLQNHLVTSCLIRLMGKYVKAEHKWVHRSLAKGGLRGCLIYDD
jgi:hypothetical protein